MHFLVRQVLRSTFPQEPLLTKQSREGAPEIELEESGELKPVGNRATIDFA